MFGSNSNNMNPPPAPLFGGGLPPAQPFGAPSFRSSATPASAPFGNGLFGNSNSTTTTTFGGGGFASPPAAVPSFGGVGSFGQLPPPVPSLYGQPPPSMPFANPPAAPLSSTFGTLPSGFGNSNAAMSSSAFGMSSNPNSGFGTVSSPTAAPPVFGNSTAFGSSHVSSFPAPAASTNASVPFGAAGQQQQQPQQPFFGSSGFGPSNSAFGQNKFGNNNTSNPAEFGGTLSFGPSSQFGTASSFPTSSLSFAATPSTTTSTPFGSTTMTTVTANPFGSSTSAVPTMSFGMSSNVISSSSGGTSFAGGAGAFFDTVNNNQNADMSDADHNPSGNSTMMFSSSPTPFGGSNSTQFSSSAAAFYEAPMNSDNEDMADEGGAMAMAAPPPSVSNLPFGTPVSLPSSTLSSWPHTTNSLSPIPETAADMNDTSASNSPVPVRFGIRAGIVVDGTDDDDGGIGLNDDDEEKLARLKAKIAEKKRRLDEQRRKKEKADSSSSSTLNPTASAFLPDGNNSSAPPRAAAMSGMAMAERNAIRFHGVGSSSANTSLSRDAGGSSSLRVHPEAESLEHAVSLVGTCQDMCPTEELERRQRETDIQLLEIPAPGTIHPSHWTLRETAVKRFRRSAADYKLDVPEWIRPPDVLERVCGYLEEWVMERDRQGADPRFPNNGTPPPLDVYQFIWDRTRMVRKDFILQNYVGTGGQCDARAVRCHERIARWHAMCEHQLSHIPDFATMQSQQNIQELGQTMKTLNQYYDDSLGRSLVEVPDKKGDETRLDLANINHGCQSNVVQGLNPVDFNGKELMNQADPQVEAVRLLGKTAAMSRHHGTAEPEMRGLYILLTIDNDGGMEVLKYAARLFRDRPEVYHSRPVQLALSIYKAKKENNYARFFALLRSPSTPYLFSCIMFMYVELMRRTAIHVMSKTYGGKTKENEALYDAYPLKKLVELLCFEDVDEARTACLHYGITVTETKVRTSSGVSLEEIIFWKQGNFQDPRDPEKGNLIPLKPRKMTRTIESKLNGVTRLAVCRGQVSGDGAYFDQNQLRLARRKANDNVNPSQQLQERAALVQDMQSKEQAQKEAAMRRRQEAEEARQQAELRRRQEEDQVKLAQLRREEEKLRLAEEERNQIMVEKARKEREQVERERDLRIRQEREKLEAEKRRRALEEKARRERERVEELKREMELEAQRKRAEHADRLRQNELKLKEEKRREAERQVAEAEEKRRREERTRIEAEIRRQERLQAEVFRQEERRRIQEQDEIERLQRLAEERRIQMEWVLKVDAARKKLIWGRLRLNFPQRLKMLDRVNHSLQLLGSSQLSLPPALLGHIQGAGMDRSLETAMKVTDFRLSVDALLKTESFDKGKIFQSLAEYFAIRLPRSRLEGIAKTTLLFNVAIIVPQSPDYRLQSLANLTRAWIHSRLGFGQIHHVSKRSMEVRIIFTDGYQGNSPTACDLAMFVAPPPWSEQTGDDSLLNEALDKMNQQVDEEIPRILMALFDSANVNIRETCMAVLAKKFSGSSGSIELVCNCDATAQSLDESLRMFFSSAIKLLTNEPPKIIERVGVLDLAFLSMTQVIWNDSNLQEHDDILDHVGQSFEYAMDEIDNLRNRSPQVTWPPSVFAIENNKVPDYFENHGGLPLNWACSLERSSTDASRRQITALLHGSVRDVIDRLLFGAPPEVRSLCASYIEMRYMRKCLESAFLWHVQSRTDQERVYFYLPKYVKSDIVMRAAKRVEQELYKKVASATFVPVETEAHDIKQIQETIDLPPDISPYAARIPKKHIVRNEPMAPRSGKAAVPAGNAKPSTRDAPAPVRVSHFSAPSGPIKRRREGEDEVEESLRDSVDLRESRAFTKRLKRFLNGTATKNALIGNGSTLASLIRGIPKPLQIIPKVSGR